MEQDSINETRSFDSILDLFKQYEDGKLDSIISGYRMDLASTGTINFRGVDIKIEFDNSGNLKFSVESLGIIDKPFNGGSQEDSFKLLTDYLKENKDGLLKRILKNTIEYTPYDLVAGNPNSLMANMVDNSYSINTRYSFNSVASYLSPSASKHTIKFGGEEKNISMLSLPLGYSFTFGKNKDWGLIFDLPLSYMDVDGSKSYSLQTGLSFVIPISKHWKLTPSARAGAIGSEDMLSGGVLYAGSLTSSLTIPINKFSIEIVNTAGIIKDYSLEVGEYEIEYDLKNNFFKNGLVVRYDLAKNYVFGVNYSNTFFTGSELYVDSYNDIGFSLTRKRGKDKFITAIALVGNYTFGDNYNAYRLGFDILF